MSCANPRWAPKALEKAKRAAERLGLFLFIPPGQRARWEFLSRADGRLKLTYWKASSPAEALAAVGGG